MTAATDETVIPFTFYGAVAQLFDSHAPEVVISGPAGTGKTRGCLEYLHYCLATTPNVKALMARKTLQSLKTSALKTYEEHINPFVDGVRFVNETRRDAAHYLYPNGSRLYIGGLDKPIKIMSTEYDLIYVPEATELDEKDWDACTIRLRNHKLPYQQLFGDCNPDAPTHWLRLRIDAGRTVEYPSAYEDNPMLWDRKLSTWTETGKDYIARLDNLTGVRYLRYRKGVWAAAEGMVYEDAWNRRLNIIDRFPIPAEWPRYLSIDFGFRNPFVCGWWAEDPDGRLYLYREIYMTQKRVEEHCKDIIRYGGYELSANDTRREPLPRDIITDHDAEDRATFEAHFVINGRRYRTVAAQKTVSPGIQYTASRMLPAGDGKPRLFIFRDAVVQRDPRLIEDKLPTCTAEEVESYVWDANKEKPVKENDHGMDMTRYMVMHKDGKNTRVTYAPSPFAR